MMTTAHLSRDRVAARTPRRGRRILNVGAALLATGSLWLASHAAGILLLVDVHGGNPPQQFGVAFLLAVTLQVSLLGWATLAGLEHFTRHARRIWVSLGIVVLALSFAPIAVVGATLGVKATLSAIHLAVAACLLPMASPGRRPHHVAAAFPVSTAA